jgi:hypothetical protein
VTSVSISAEGPLRLLTLVGPVPGQR